MNPIPFVAVLYLATACSTTSAAVDAVPTFPTPVVSASVAVSGPVSSSAPTTSSTSLSTGAVVMLPNRGQSFESAADIAAATWLTSDEKAFLTTELTRLQAPGKTCATLAVTGYRVADLMSGRVDLNPGSCGGGSGHMALWGLVSGSWKTLTASQQTPSCSSIREAGWTSTVPKEFVGGICVDAKGAEVAYTP